VSFSVEVYLIYMQCELKLMDQNEYGVGDLCVFSLGVIM
jgi:hypothetical protein